MVKEGKVYDLNGLYYQMKSDGWVLGIVGLVFLLSSHFWAAEKRNLKELMIGIICSLLCICFTGYHIYVINNLNVAVHEGTFVEENRENPYLFRMKYCFTSAKGLKPLFYLDIFSKKKIYPDKLEKGVVYRIYYEEKTDVIVKIEKLE